MPVITAQAVDQDCKEDWAVGYIGSISSFSDTSSVENVGLLFGTNYLGGHWWQHIDIPNGATINSAILTIVVASNYGGPPTVSLVGRKEANPGIFKVDVGSSIHETISANPTTATVSKTFASGITDTVDVTTIVQEIVNQGAWANNNAMAIGIIPTISSGQTTLTTTEGGTASTITIDYSSGGAAYNPGKNLCTLGVG